ncbi:hypothetical protein BJ095_101251 [Ureibacillus chungkukjangi]|uniref:Uncharacterized protein n=1 Tax=Ureibacillus chungkukjangi TaxID=1202712 RepID=A0A318U3S8_9BACL|nr:hypothetical protein BJ095_101251 [Ureibacillus chungkukjangi]
MKRVMNVKGKRNETESGDETRHGCKGKVKRVREW